MAAGAAVGLAGPAMGLEGPAVGWAGLAIGLAGPAAPLAAGPAALLAAGLELDEALPVAALVLGIPSFVVTCKTHMVLYELTPLLLPKLVSPTLLPERSKSLVLYPTISTVLVELIPLLLPMLLWPPLLLIVKVTIVVIDSITMVVDRTSNSPPTPAFPTTEYLN